MNPAMYRRSLARAVWRALIAPDSGRYARGLGGKGPWELLYCGIKKKGSRFEKGKICPHQVKHFTPQRATKKKKQTKTPVNVKCSQQ